MYLENAPTVPLEPIGPKPGATDGEPFESAVEIFDDGRTEVGVWECTPGSFPSQKEGISEIMYFIGGEGTITDADGTPHAIGPGVEMMFPDGWKGSWEIRETIRKIYVIVKSSTE